MNHKAVHGPLLGFVVLCVAAPGAHAADSITAGPAPIVVAQKTGGVPRAGVRRARLPYPSAAPRPARPGPKRKAEKRKVAAPKKDESIGGAVGSLIGDLLSPRQPKKRKPSEMGIHGGKSIHER